ncbi:MAG: MFS transporter [Candidatus Heimdallarchaeaceae archaeon]
MSVNATIQEDDTKFKQYMFFWGGQLFSMLGSNIVQFVLILWISFETESELMLGLSSLVAFGPFLVLGPIAGVLVDRLNRKLIIFSADATIAITTVAAILLFYTNNMTLYWFFIIIAIRGIGDTFHYTAVGAMMPTMVPQKHLSRMNGINSLANGVIRIIGPAIAAGFLAIGGGGLLRHAHLLWMDIATFTIAIVPLIMITIPKVSSALEKGEKISFFKDFKDALLTIKGINGLFPLLIMFMFVNFFFTPFGTLLPLFVVKTHFGFEADYAIVVAFLQAGTVIGSLIMTFFKGFKKKALSSYLAIMWAFSIFTTLYFLPSNELWMVNGKFWIMGAITFLIVIVLPMINVSLITAFQIIIPQEKLGRTMSVLGTLSSAIQPIAMLLSGVIGEYTGIPIVYLVSGILGVVLCSILWFTTKASSLDQTLNERMDEMKQLSLSSIPETPQTSSVQEN